MPVDPNLPILVVDDYRDMLRLIGSQLESLGFRNIEQVTDAAAALERMRTKRYGLVISDLNMQPMSGIQFLRRIRADPDLKSIPFVMVSGSGTQQAVASVKELGVEGFIVKPFTTATLKSKLMQALGAF